MKKRNLLVFTTVAVILISGTVPAQQEEQNYLTGNLYHDASIVSQNYVPAKLNQVPLPTASKKSPMIAGLMSLVIPGAGEIYTENYLKGAIFFVVEAAVITTAVIYDKKGDNKTDEFEVYADDQWSAVKYAQWLYDNRERYEQIPDNFNIEDVIISNDPSLDPWKRVNWSKLNEIEAGFSHKLPRHGDQQYYELIGKYPQYSPGWVEFDPAEPDYHVLPPQFLSYSVMRGDANNYYNVASKAIIVMYINHFLSMLDGIWSAINYNDDLAVNFRMETQQFADQFVVYPKLNLSLNF